MSQVNHGLTPPGLGVGSLASPPLAGWIFLLEPLGVLWLVLAMVLLQVLILLLLLLLLFLLPLLLLIHFLLLLLLLLLLTLQVVTVAGMWRVSRGAPCPSS